MRNKTKLFVMLAVFFACYSSCFAIETITMTWQAIGENNFKFATVQATEGKNYIVDWGDDSSTTFIGSANHWENEISHTYENAGTYNVIITADTEDCHFVWIDLYDVPDMNNAVVTALDVSGLTQLKNLGTTNNPLATLNVSGCISLEELLCENNALTELNLSGLSKLDTLFCASNQLTALNASGLDKLVVLSCPDNQLTELNVTGCTALTELKCEVNQLTALNVESCAALRLLWCYKNPLQTLTVNGLQELTQLLCYEGALTSLNMNGCSNLHRLECYQNQLTELNVNGCTALEYFLCNENQLTQLDVSECTALSEFRCFTNQLTALNVNGLTELTILHCHDNEIAELNMTGVTGLNSLDCSVNQITSLDLSNFTALIEIRCFENRLQLSDLYAISEMISNEYYKFLGTQTLAPVNVLVGETADFSTQIEFSDTPTLFEVEKDGSPAAIDTDYTMEDGIFTFLAEGSFQITMTNEAIVSYEAQPAIVIAEYNVGTETNIVDVAALNNITVYPNPTQGLLQITDYELQQAGDIKIYDMSGRMVEAKSAYTESGVMTIDISHLLKGIYFLKMNDTTVKVVKQ